MTNDTLEHHSKKAQALVESNNSTPVHNAGFVRLVRFMGGDASIVQAARVSYGVGTKTLREDVGLLRYLITHHHWSPFEQVALTFHVKLPIFVARQFVRHRTAKLNEVSARYTELSEEFYNPFPEIDLDSTYDNVPIGSTVAVRAQDTKNRQGSDGKIQVDARVVFSWLEAQSDAFLAYKDMLAAGVSRELDRACLPVSTYTEWYWQMDLRNLLHFFSLRCDSHAQQEARDYAEAMRDIARLVAPKTMEIVDELKGAA